MSPTLTSKALIIVTQAISTRDAFSQVQHPVKSGQGAARVPDQYRSRTCVGRGRLFLGCLRSSSILRISPIFARIRPIPSPTLSSYSIDVTILNDTGSKRLTVQPWWPNSVGNVYSRSEELPITTNWRRNRYQHRLCEDYDTLRGYSVPPCRSSTSRAGDAPKVLRTTCHLFGLKAARFPTIYLVHRMDSHRNVSIRADGEGSGRLQKNANSSGNGDKQKPLDLRKRQSFNISGCTKHLQLLYWT